ncbi:MAG: phosphate ABC transporter permease subunit PstC [Thermoplasmata archaeon]|nr:phosphate ABC transporter permease subunit PstC [Thermoplasmata archaeon]
MVEANPFPTPPQRGRRSRWWGDLIFHAVTLAGALVLLGFLLLLVLILFQGSELAFQTFGYHFILNRGTPAWDAVEGQEYYSILPFLLDTIVTSTIALAIALPVALGSSLFLTQLAPQFIPRALRKTAAQVIDLLAAIPSIIYGFWGLEVLVPIMAHTVEPGLHEYLGWTGAFGGPEHGLDIFTASIVLSIMIIPTIAAISRESLAAVPVHQREAALSLGATEWEAARFAVIPYARSGIFGGTILGLGRALGETMAVTLLIGGGETTPTSLFSTGQTIASKIASSYGENSGKLEVSSLLAAGLVLLAITFLVNIAARVILWRYQRQSGVGRE